MAKSAKHQDVELTKPLINGIVKEVMFCIENIDSAKGRYMVAARRQRDAIQVVYERAASKGIPQRVMKLQIRIEQMQNKLTGLITDLEFENRRMLKRIVKLRGDKAQLALFADLPDIVKPPKSEKPTTNGGGNGREARPEGAEAAGVS